MNTELGMRFSKLITIAKWTSLQKLKVFAGKVRKTGFFQSGFSGISDTAFPDLAFD
jgi:hypothetical protein